METTGAARLSGDPLRQLEEMNLEAKAERVAGKDPGQIREERMKYLTDEKRIKAVTVCFTDLEGRLHMLDYDKKFLLKSADNLTFDGSSVRGFSRRPSPTCASASTGRPSMAARRRLRPRQGPRLRRGLRQDGTPYGADMRARLKQFAAQLREEGHDHQRGERDRGLPVQGRATPNVLPRNRPFEFISTGGYYHSLPSDPLRQFIDTAAEVQRAWASPTRRTTPKWRPRSSR